MRLKSNYNRYFSLPRRVEWQSVNLQVTWPRITGKQKEWNTLYRPRGTITLWLHKSWKDSRYKRLTHWGGGNVVPPQSVKHSFRTGPEKPGKVPEFYCGIFQHWKVLEKGCLSWKVLVNSSKNYELCGRHYGELTLGSWEWRVKVNFRVLEKSIWVLEICFLKRLWTL